MEDLYHKLRFSIKDGDQALAVSSQEADNINLSFLEEHLLGQRIINYNLEAIDRVIHNATDEPEIIGPVFEKFNNLKNAFIKIKNDGFSAKMIVTGNPGDKADEKITIADLLYKIKIEKIRDKHIKYDVVKEIIDTQTFNTDFVVAEGLAPENGDDAKIDYKIDVEHIGQPKELEDGRADYKNIGKVLIVTANQVLAEKIPPTKGTPGENLFGEEIPAVEGEDTALPAGKNTSLSDDTMKLFASVDGYVYTSDLGINVGETFMVDGDLDYNTGNIEYNGDVFIKNNVLPDFKVISENGNVYIDGEVENAHIEARNGNVVIKRGLFGDHSFVKGDQVVVDFIQGESKVEAKSVIIKKFNYGGHIKAEDSIKMSTMIGGTAECEKIIDIDEVGSESSSDTFIRIYNSRIEEIAILIEKGESDFAKLEENLTEVSQQIQLIKRKLTIKKDISVEDKKDAAEKINKYNKLKEWMEKLEKTLVSLKGERSQILSASDSAIHIKTKLFPNVKIHFFNSHYFSKDLYTGTKTIDVNTLQL